MKVPLINAIPTFNLIKNFADNISNPKKLIESNLKSSKETLGAQIGAAGVVYTASNPKKALELVKKVPSAVKTAGNVAIAGGVGLLGYGVLSETKKPIQLVSKAPEAVVSGGKTIGKALESGSFSEAYGHLSGYAKEHPVATGLAGLGAVIIGGKLVKGLLGTAYVGSKLDNINKKIDEGGFTPVIPDILPTSDNKREGEKQDKITQTTPALASPSYIEPATTQTGWIQEETSKKAVSTRKKTKHLYKSPVNIRNNIIIANKNG